MQNLEKIRIALSCAIVLNLQFVIFLSYYYVLTFQWLEQKNQIFPYWKSKIHTTVTNVKTITIQ